MKNQEKTRPSVRYLCSVLGAIVLGVWVGGNGRSQERAPDPLPEGAGKELVATACTQCHGIGPIVNLRDGPDGWKRAVDEMILRGTQLTPEEAEVVVEYLSGNFGPGMNPMRTGPLPAGNALSSAGGQIDSSAIALPAGDGKDLVEDHCAVCHDLGRVVTLRRTRQEWEQMVRNMMGRGLTATEPQLQRMISYLVAQFGVQSK